MKASELQKRYFDKVFDSEWRKLFRFLMERKNVVISEVLRDHELRTVKGQTETDFFDELAKDAIHYWIREFYEQNKTPMIRSEDEIMKQIKDILK